MTNILTYSPDKVIIMIGGVYKAEHLAENDFVTVSKNISPTSAVKSIDGEQARIVRVDNMYTVELSLAQTSKTNDYLSTIFNIDQATGLGKFPLYIKDLGGSSIFFAGTAWVQSIPNLTYSSGMTVRRWTLACDDAGIQIGGNAEDSTVADILGLGSSSLPILTDLGVL